MDNDDEYVIFLVRVSSLRKAAERAKELAERELEDQKSEMDYSLASAQLAEAAARLKALQKLRKK